MGDELIPEQLSMIVNRLLIQTQGVAWSSTAEHDHGLALRHTGISDDHHRKLNSRPAQLVMIQWHRHVATARRDIFECTGLLEKSVVLNQSRGGGLNRGYRQSDQQPELPAKAQISTRS